MGESDMLEKLKGYADTAKTVWAWLQDFASLKGGLYVDAFAIVFLVRLLAPLRGFPPLNYSEAGMWAATIAGFSYSNKGPKNS